MSSRQFFFYRAVLLAWRSQLFSRSDWIWLGHRRLTVYQMSDFSFWKPRKNVYGPGKARGSAGITLETSRIESLNIFTQKKISKKIFQLRKKLLFFRNQKNLDFFFWKKKSRFFSRKMKNWKSEIFSRFPKKSSNFQKNPKILKISKKLSFWNFSKKNLGNRFQ